jgi:hypothetical protein
LDSTLRRTIARGTERVVGLQAARPKRDPIAESAAGD